MFDLPIMNETLVGILTYDGCSTDIALNYVALTINTLALIRLSYHLQSSYTYCRSVRHVWILLALFLLVFQVVLCLLVGCSGISIIWSAQIGFCWSFRSAYHSPSSSETIRLHLLVGISSVLDCGLWIYYSVIADQLTTLAHGCAVLLGMLLARIVHQIAQTAYTTLETKIITMDEILIQPVFGVEVRDSWIPGSGQGLFATVPTSKGQVICRYVGRIMTTTEAMRTRDKSYLMRLGGFTYVDAKASPECLARYINDCRNPLGYNVTFVKKPEEHCADIMATRDISVGEEFFADYGKWYWIGMSPNRLSLAQLLKLRGIVT